jgi:hypothetical protein
MYDTSRWVAAPGVEFTQNSKKFAHVPSYTLKFILTHFLRTIQIRCQIGLKRDLPPKPGSLFN